MNTIYNPNLVSELTYQSIERERAHPEYLSLGLKEFVDPTSGADSFVMARKSKVIGLLGDTSQGKTSLMRYIAANMIKQINLDSNEIGLFVTWEDNVEDFGMVDFANITKIPVRSLYNGQVTKEEFDKVLSAYAVRSAIPLWLVGHSETSHARPMLTMTDIFDVCEHITTEQGKRIRFIMLDYLQRISREDTKERDTRMQFVKIMDNVKNLALTYSTCVFIGSQVRRDQVEKGKWRQPQAHWAMETSNFEHSCDGMLSVWMPYKSSDAWKLGDQLTMKEGDREAVHVTKELMSIQVLKQKYGETGMLRFVDFVPEYGLFVKRGTADEVRWSIKNGTFTD